jgi:soluble lytic murein transglycosylase-like protein
MRTWLRCGLVASVLLLTAGAGRAGAEIICLSSGRMLSVRSHRIDGNTITFALRAGGEISCPLSLVRDILPDEVPYPDPPAPAALASVTLPAVPFADLIDAASAAHGVDPRLVRAMIAVESAYQPRAVSPKGAMGLMQLMPATARQYAVADPFDPKANIEAGVQHLKSLLGRFELGVALAAYNAGEAAVQRSGGIPPYRETRDYVSRILALLPRR